MRRLTLELSENQSALLALSTVSGLGPSRLEALCAHFGSSAAVLRASSARLRDVRGIGSVLADQIATLNPEAEVKKQLARAQRVSAFLVMRSDRAYPPLLREIHYPPAFMWVRGRTDLPLQPMIAIVGSRKATRSGEQIAFGFASGLASAGYTVVSGLAYGIDSAAHRGAIAAGGLTVAVLGSGVDVVYPGANRALFRKVLGAGAVYSEFPMGTKPDGTNFPRRNRLISGMTLGVVVIEAYEKGGGLITAKFALDQNREVFCVPGSIMSSASVGCNRMIRDGCAKLVTCVEDVMVELPQPTVQKHGVRAFAPSISKSEELLLAAIEEGGSAVEDISVVVDMETTEAMVMLLEMEIRGLVRQSIGGVFHVVPDVFAMRPASRSPTGRSYP